MAIGLNVLVMIVGLLIYILTNKPESNKIAEIGRIMFAFALLALLLGGDQIVRVLGFGAGGR
jgi:hypothetical protein